MNTIDRDAVIEAIKSVEIKTFRLGWQTYEDCSGTIEEIIDVISALKSRPAQPDPRDETLRLARDSLDACRGDSVAKEVFRRKALAAIDEALKGDN